MTVETLQVGTRLRYWRTECLTKVNRIWVEGMKPGDKPLVWLEEEIIRPGKYGSLKVGVCTNSTLLTVIDMMQQELVDVEDGQEGV